MARGHKIAGTWRSHAPLFNLYHGQFSIYDRPLYMAFSFISIRSTLPSFSLLVFHFKLFMAPFAPLRVAQLSMAPCATSLRSAFNGAVCATSRCSAVHYQLSTINYSHPIHIPLHLHFQLAHIPDCPDDFFQPNKSRFAFNHIIEGMVVHTIYGHIYFILGR